jgi:uroporphyrinogen-III synthase
VTLPLAGLTVVVTRPERQAAHFIELAQRAGARCLPLPAIEIEPVLLDEATRSRLAPDGHDWVIYTSANAVEASLAQLPRPSTCRVAAVGRATAQALRAHGIAVNALPEGRSDSEGLLDLPALSDVAGQRILILRGVGGRELLREQLAQRGATVQVGEVYRRRLATAAPAVVEDLADALRCTADALVVAVTSVEVLDGLLALVPPSSASQLRTTLLLLPGERVAAAARERLWTGEIVTAASAEDAAMLAALETHLAQRRAHPRA